jgi:arginase family enzyme
VVGVPSSAGSYAAGQDQAPGALRSAGLVEALVAAGREVRDDGDLPAQVWRPDRDHPRAQNADQVTACKALAADPGGAAGNALGYLPPGPLAVHIDVDVLDFTDAPLAENTDGRNSGPTLDQAGEALRVAARDPRLRSLSIGELNPTRSAGDPEAIPRFVGVLADVLAAAAS